MKASDYIVEYLIEKGITDVFGYPGGMVTHLMDSFSKYSGKIYAHMAYNEQGAALAACGYAQISGLTGVAYATSGPGATNMVTGIANAYMDSIPTLFITGQVNSFEQKGDLQVRQRGFQETDIVSMVKAITKFAVQVNSSNEIKYYLDYAFHLAHEGRKGPVLLDIAMDVMRAEVNPQELESYVPKNVKLDKEWDKKLVKEKVLLAKRPVLVLGNGVNRANNADFSWKEILNKIGIPVVSSMISVDLKNGLENYYGFIGAYGDRVANFVVAKSDLVLAVGTRLDIRQVGVQRENFAANATLIRVDIDNGELEYKVHADEISICADANRMLPELLYLFENNYTEWISICDVIKSKLHGIDEKISNKYIRALSNMIPDNLIITTDVGQNQVWVAQSLVTKLNQRVLFSGGHGAMGYSLPAAIGACIASNRRKVISFNGDGGIQMNIQELQMISRETLPIKIIILNNSALGMIRHFQEMYFGSNYFQTTTAGGFTSPDFCKLAEAYRIDYISISTLDEVALLDEIMSNNKATIIEIKLQEDTYVFPKLEFGKPNQDQEPLLDRELYNYLNML